MSIAAIDTQARTSETPTVGRLTGAVYGIVTYVVFAATLAYAILFICGVGLSSTIDGPASTLGTGAALAINLALLGLFGLQHSVMARPAFKRWWTRIIPASMERQTYVLATCLCFGALFLWWQPMTGVVWSVESVAGTYAIYASRTFGWIFMASSTLLINHLDLFGLRQTWFHWRGRKYEEIGFRTPGWYKRVRHPIQLGFLIAFWSSPHMTVGAFVFAAVCTAYIFVALFLEERDLTAAFGEQYANYKRQVGQLHPFRRYRDSASDARDSSS